MLFSSCRSRRCTEEGTDWQKRKSTSKRKWASRVTLTEMQPCNFTQAVKTGCVPCPVSGDPMNLRSKQCETDLWAFRAIQYRSKLALIRICACWTQPCLALGLTQELRRMVRVSTQICFLSLCCVKSKINNDIFVTQEFLVSSVQFCFCRWDWS